MHKGLMLLQDERISIVILVAAARSLPALRALTSQRSNLVPEWYLVTPKSKGPCTNIPSSQYDLSCPDSLLALSETPAGNTLHVT